MEMDELFDCRICGIPATIRVTEWEPEIPAVGMFGPWEDSEPGVPAGGCWEVCDRRGRPAPWLARKLADDEVEFDRIESLVYATMEEPHDDPCDYD